MLILPGARTQKSRENNDRLIHDIRYQLPLFNFPVLGNTTTSLAYLKPPVAHTATKKAREQSKIYGELWQLYP